MKFPPILACAMCIALLACDQDAVAPNQSASISTDDIELTPPDQQNPKGKRFRANLTYDGYMMSDLVSCVALPRTTEVQPVELKIEGRVSQMGRVTGVITGCKQMPYFYGLTNVTGTLSSSNGQELWFKCDQLTRWYDNEELNMVVYRGDADIVGGMGRFEGATGNFKMIVTQDLSLPEDTMKGEADFDGTIAY